MKFSLVMATLGRTSQIERFLTSLEKQQAEHELVVVDQNPDDRLERLLEPWHGRVNIVHLRSEKGLSRSRNVALRHITGDLVAFPDDDCWYPDGLLARVVQGFSERPEVDGFTSRQVSHSGVNAGGTFDPEPGPVTRSNVFRRAISSTLFLRRRLVDAVGPFDEALGLGAGTPWGSGEDSDYPLRALQLGFRLHYDPSLAVGHDDVLADYGSAAVKRAFSYGAGHGRLLRKHRFPILDVGYTWVRPAGGVVLSLLQAHPRKARYHAAVLAGRLRGFLSPFGDMEAEKR